LPFEQDTEWLEVVRLATDLKGVAGNRLAEMTLQVPDRETWKQSHEIGDVLSNTISLSRRRAGGRGTGSGKGCSERSNPNYDSPESHVGLLRSSRCT